MPQPNTRPPDDDADLFDWRMVGQWVLFVLGAPRRHKVVASVAFLSVVAAAAIGTQVLPFRYQVQATLLAQPSPLMTTLSTPGMSRDWDTPAQTARDIMLGRDSLVAICEQTDFVNRYLAGRAPAVRARDWLRTLATGKERSPDQILDGLVAYLQDRLLVNVNLTGTVTITLQWTDPDVAFRIVQAALNSFLEDRYASEVRAVSETIAILESHQARVHRDIAATIQQVEEKERALRIRSGSRRWAPAVPLGARDEEISRIETALAARQRALADLEAFRTRRLAELRELLLQQEGIYAAQHPALQSTRQAIESLSRPSPQVAALHAEVQELRRDLAKRGGTSDPTMGPLAFPQEIAEAQLRLEDPRLEFERRQLQNLLRQNANLIERIDTARVAMDTAQASFKYRYRVIAPPQMPRGPLKPYALMLIVGGLIGGTSLALFASVALDLWLGRVVHRVQVEGELKLPVLGELER